MLAKKIEVYVSQQVSTSTFELINELNRSFQGAKILKTNPDEIRKPHTLDDNTLAFFLPGIPGDNSPYTKEIGPKNNAIIRRYVEEGGVFVGICAGAYYACDFMLYDPPWLKVPKTSSEGLHFFNALARGPAKGHSVTKGCNKTIKISFQTASSARHEADVVYSNGPILFPQKPYNDLEVIARYEDLPNKPIAIASRKIGKGLAIFIGPHIDIGYDIRHENVPHLQDFMKSLEKYEPGRQKIWDLIIAKIKQHNADLGRVTLLQKPVM